MVVIGDWDDVDASVASVIGRFEMAVLSSSASQDEQTFELLMISDEPAFVYARRAPRSGDAMIPITLSCKVGYFGDPVKEKQFIVALAARLKDLAGVDFRPDRSRD